MDPLTALALAAEAIKIGDALINAYVATRAAVAAGDLQVTTARLQALKQQNDALSARVHAELQAIVAKGEAHG